MDTAVPIIPLTNLLIGFIPVVLLLVIMHAWSLNALQAIYANGRMLIQLLAIGYVLTFVLETDEPMLVLAVIAFMIVVSAWIALRPLEGQRLKQYSIVLISISACGISVMLLVTQLILDSSEGSTPHGSDFPGDSWLPQAARAVLSDRPQLRVLPGNPRGAGPPGPGGALPVWRLSGGKSR